jgi:hypothetical protein
MAEKDHTQEQTIEYNPESYVRRDDAQTAAKMLAEYLNGNGMETEGRIVENIQQVLAARGHEPDDGFDMYGERVTYVDADGAAFAGVVMEPNVTTIPADECWDPHKEAYVDPADYPLGTIQLIYFPGGLPGEDMFFDRIGDIEVETSVPPATHPDDTWCYFPGWEYAEKLRKNEA